MIMIKKMRCPQCGYEWTPRTKKPKSCPKCKQYFKTGKRGDVKTWVKKKI